jgi:hypothetical protein
MADVLVRLKNFESPEAAAKTADAIANAGGIHYTDASGSEVNVTVGDVTVENN